MREELVQKTKYQDETFALQLEGLRSETIVVKRCNCVFHSSNWKNCIQIICYIYNKVWLWLFIFLYEFVYRLSHNSLEICFRKTWKKDAVLILMMLYTYKKCKYDKLLLIFLGYTLCSCHWQEICLVFV